MAATRPEAETASVTRVQRSAQGRRAGAVEAYLDRLDAELAALPDRPLLVAPAIPAFGRVVRQGRVEGFGVATPIEIAPLLGARAADALIPDTETEAAMEAALAAAPEGDRRVVNTCTS